MFMCNMRAREAFISALPKNQYSQVKLLQTSHEIWKAFKSNFESDTHAKRMRLWNWKCLFQDAKMMEDESIRNYIGRISIFFAGIKSHDLTREEDEVMWKILKTLTPPFKQISQMIQLLIPYAKDFIGETLLGRLEAMDVDLRQSRDLARVEMTFSALIV